MVGNVQRIQAHLKREAVANVEDALDVGVQPVQSVSAAIANPAREHARLKCRGLQGGIGYKPGRVEPGVERLRPAAADSIRVAVIEETAPVEQRARLVFVRPGDLPAAEHGVSQPAARQSLAFAEWKLPNARR